MSSPEAMDTWDSRARSVQLHQIPPLRPPKPSSHAGVNLDIVNICFALRCVGAVICVTACEI
jgi:hypothetical protein